MHLCELHIKRLQEKSKIMGNISEGKVCIHLFKVSMTQNLTIIIFVSKYLNFLRIIYGNFMRFFFNKPKLHAQESINIDVKIYLESVYSQYHC